MSTNVKTYTDSKGKQFQLLAFDNTRLYTPTEKESVMETNRDFYAAIKADEDAKENARIKAEYEKTRPLTPTEYYEANAAIEAERKLKEALNEKALQDVIDAKEEFLKSRPDVVEVTENSLSLFLNSLQHWFSKGYKQDANSLQTVYPNFFSINLNKGK